LTLASTKIEKAEAICLPRTRFPGRLTDKAIKSAKARAEAYSVVDGGGLYLCVTPAGGKLWRWSIGLRGKEKLMSFGRVSRIFRYRMRGRSIATAGCFLLKASIQMAQRKAEKNRKEGWNRNSFQSVATKWWNIGHHEKKPAICGLREAPHGRVVETPSILAQLFTVIRCLDTLKLPRVPGEQNPCVFALPPSLSKPSI